MCMKKYIFFCLLLLTAVEILAQPGDRPAIKVYNIQPSIDIPLTTVAAVTFIGGQYLVSQKSPLDSLRVVYLDPSAINRFDRSATRQNAGYAYTAKTISDVSMYSSLALPFLLLTDREIRKDWEDVLVLYLETEAIVGNIFTWGGNIPFNRIRPLAYNPEMPFGDRLLSKNKNSFFSGHTSTTAAASFFMAKVYCDYHPELGNKKIIIYSLAVIPPAFTGLFRYKGMKHYPSDILMGLAIGAGTGILVPAFHKQRNAKFVLIPFSGPYNGLAFSLKL